MLDGLLDPASLANVGPAGVLVIVVLLVLFGRLVPVRTVDRELKAERERGDGYKAAWEATDARNDVLAAQVGELLELAKTSNALIQALQSAAGRSREPS